MNADEARKLSEQTLVVPGTLMAALLRPIHTAIEVQAKQGARSVTYEWPDHGITWGQRETVIRALIKQGYAVTSVSGDQREPYSGIRITW